MGLGWSLEKVSACAAALVLGGALASACGGQAYTDRLEGFSGSAGSMSSGVRGGAGGSLAGSGSARGGAAGSSGVAGRGGASGSSGVAAGGSAAVSGSGGGPARSMGRPCNSPVAISGGWVQCADGLLQRSEPAACTSRLPRPAPDLTGVPQEFINSLECVQDQDCTARPNGYCAFDITVRGVPRCEYGCVSDGDCGPSQACVCGSDIGECAPASCLRGTDCPVGFACLIGDDGCGAVSVSCETSADQCRSDGDCAAGQSCTYNGGARVCSFVGCDEEDL